MTKPRILLYSSREEPEETLQGLRAHGYSVVLGEDVWQQPGGAHEDELLAASQSAVALLGGSIRATPISRRVMEAAQNLRIIAKYTVGVDDVDTDAATELGIMVCHAPTEDNCFAVAENTVGLMLGVLQKLQSRDADIRAGKWRMPYHAGTFVGARASDGYPGLTIGIVGLGRIGTRFAQLMAPWRARVIAYDPYIEPMRFLLAGVQAVDYETLLREADVISYHVVLTKETRGMCGTKEFALMKKNAIVLNTARGGIVDEGALAEAIKEGRIAGGAIDAFVDEPPSLDSPLRKLGDKLVLSPHAAGFNGDGELRGGIQWAARSVVTALSGKLPDNIYNKEVIHRWKERFGGLEVSTGA